MTFKVYQQIDVVLQKAISFDLFWVNGVLAAGTLKVQRDEGLRGSVHKPTRMTVDFRKQFNKDFKVLSEEFDSSHGDNDRMIEIIQKQIQVCYAYIPLITDPLESVEIENNVTNLTTRLMVLKLTGDLQKDVAKLTTNIDDLQEKSNQ